MPKLPVEQPVMLHVTGIEGDWQRNRKYHGGPDKAVLMIAQEVIDDLAARGYPVYAGALGENLTVAGLSAGEWRTGQRYRIGKNALIELTTLRVPCLNLDVYGPAIKGEIFDMKIRRGDASSERWAKGGFYARVLNEGIVQVGNTVALVEG